MSKTAEEVRNNMISVWTKFGTVHVRMDKISYVHGNGDQLRLDIIVDGVEKQLYFMNDDHYLVYLYTFIGAEIEGLIPPAK